MTQFAYPPQTISPPDWPTPIPQAEPPPVIALALPDAVLQKFCGTHGIASRHCFETPFVCADWKYATDGRIGIRIPCGEPNTNRAERSLPTLHSLNQIFTPPAAEVVYLPWPKLQACIVCDGSGIGPRCLDCINGLRTCGECKQAHPCKKCKGIGFAGKECNVCRIEHWSVLNRSRIAHHYIWLVKQLPGAEFAADTNADAVRFRFTGGDGVVMAIANDEK